GQKCPINGGINLSILDGWWVEGFRGDNGWAIGQEIEAATAEEQDAADAPALYRILEEEAVPIFFEKDARGLRRHRSPTLKASIASVVPHFRGDRMVRDYVEKSYLPAAKR